MPKKIKKRVTAKQKFVDEWLEKNGLTRAYLNQQAVEEGLIAQGEKLTNAVLYTMAVQCELTGLRREK